MMSVQQPPPQSITMVAVDKDKNSRHAFQWALNHLYNPVIIAVHVKHKNIPNQGTNVFPPDEEDVANIFNTLRGMCDRKSVKMKEAVIDDSDVVRGLLEFANRNVIHSIVIGASTMKPLQSLKKSKGYNDIPTAIIKSVPDYCYVYIISKLKIISARPAIIRPMAKTFIPPNLQAFPPSESENVVRAQELRSGGINEGPEAKAFEKSNDAVRTQVRERQRSAGSNLSIEKIDLSGRRHRSMDDRVILELVSMDVTKEDLDALGTSSAFQSSGRAKKEIEAEMKRLRLELKQTMKMYSSACKQAISAKTQAEQIRQWKLEGERKVEEVWLSQEAALAMAEKEKARAKAALEAAEEAKKMAEQEAQRREDVEMKARKETEERDQAFNGYRKYTIEEIEAATQKFSPSKKIGEGGYGPVYKAQLDHTPVAIKILNPNATQGWKQFHQEIEVLSCIRHPNMVLLLGACPENGCLVYEYMDNGSLEDRLFRKGNSPPISWRKRFQIAAEIAIALLFLHETKPEPIVHRDLKPANILLNRNYVSKISDVGLARLVPPSVADTVTQYYMTSAAGTFCYIDPEYQQTGILTTKSDIYSLGIMLLQIITAKPPMGLTHHVRRAIKKDKFPEILDPVVTDWPVEEALSFAKLALSCAELSKKDRPSLATVVLPELNRLSDLGCNLRNNQVISSDDQSKSQATLPPTPTLSQLSKTLTKS